MKERISTTCSSIDKLGKRVGEGQDIQRHPSCTKIVVALLPLIDVDGERTRRFIRSDETECKSNEIGSYVCVIVIDANTQ